jgi:hypothetical protein
VLVTVTRFVSDDDSTASLVAVDDEFVCFGIEDEKRAHKIPAETRIPAGCYPVVLRHYGGFHKKYLLKFPDWHEGMLEICHVPLFSDVLIHIGNTEADTAGCLLVNAGVSTAGGRIRGSASAEAYKRLYSKIVQAALAKDLYIEFTDED